MPDLDPIIQDIIVEAQQAIDEMEEVAKVALEAGVAFDDLLKDVISTSEAFQAGALTAGDYKDDIDSLLASLRGMSESEESAGAAVVAADAAMSVQKNTVQDLKSQFAQAGLALRALKAAEKDAAGGMAEKTAAAAFQSEALDNLKGQLGQAALVASIFSAAEKKAAADTTAAGTATRYAIGWWRLSGNAIHWIISGFAELAAVLVPAMVAFGAWAAVWLQGTTNVVEHIKSVYIATEALANAGAETAGQMMGLGKALQTAQNEANANVYQALGAAVLIVNERFTNLAQVGRTVGEVFDAFMGRLVYDFSAAGGAGQVLGGLLRDMIPDLVEIGQIFGNLGHSIALFAAQMPGLAEVLLKILDVFTDVIKIVLEFSLVLDGLHIPVLTAVIAFEEFNRWGSLLINLLGKLGFVLPEVTGGFLSLQRGGGIALGLFRVIPNLISTTSIALGGFIARLGATGGMLERAGNALTVFGLDVDFAAAAVSPLAAALILLSAVALGIIIDKWVTATSAAEKFTEQLNKQVQAAKGMAVFATAANAISQLTDKENQASQAVKDLSDKYPALADHTNSATVAAYGFRSGLAAQQTGYNTTRAAMATYDEGILQQAQNIETATKNAQLLARTFGITVPEAAELAGQANVSLTSKLQNQKGQWTALGDQVRAQEQAYKSMGPSAGAVGNYMEAVAVATGLAASKVQTLNQDIDQFAQNLTSGTGAMGGFEVSLQNIGSIAATTGNNLTASVASMNLSVGQFAKALKTDTGAGAQAWQNFDQVMGSTLPQLSDWFRTAGAEGALGLGQIKTGILSALSQVIPFAKESTTAQATVLGWARANGITAATFPDLVEQIKDAHANQKKLNDVVNDGTIAMANLSKIAQNMGDVLQGQVTSALSQAALQASGFYRYTTLLADALEHGTAAGHNAAYWANEVAKAEQNASNNAQTAANNVTKLAAANARLHDVKISVTEVLQTVGSLASVGGGAYGGGGAGHAVGPGGGVYDSGGLLPPGLSFALNKTGDFEAILTPGQLGGLMNAAAASGAGGGTSVHIHMGGSVFGTLQEITRAVQTGLNQKTLRNGSTQIYIPGRKH